MLLFALQFKKCLKKGNLLCVAILMTYKEEGSDKKEVLFQIVQLL